MMEMYEKKQFPRTAYDLDKMYKEGKLSFDNAVQRSLVWNNDQKSLLIHSMIIDFPIPPMYCNCIFEDPKKRVYDFLDGKQRIRGTVIPYLNDEFALTNVPPINIDEEAETDEDADPDKLIDINGLKFSELPMDFQRKISNFNFVIYYYENMSQEDCEEMIARLNGGKSFTAIELTRVKAKSFDKIKLLGKHELFTTALTEKALNKYTNEDIVIKSWALLNIDNPSFETKFIRPLIETADITDDQVTALEFVYNRILETYRDLIEAGDKAASKIAKRIVTRTHLLSLVPIAFRSINDNIPIEDFEGFVLKFFSGKKSASINDEYNRAAGAHSASPENVKKRNDAITAAYNEYFSNSNTLEACVNG